MEMQITINSPLQGSFPLTLQLSLLAVQVSNPGPLWHTVPLSPHRGGNSKNAVWPLIVPEHETAALPQQQMPPLKLLLRNWEIYEGHERTACCCFQKRTQTTKVLKLWTWSCSERVIFKHVRREELRLSETYSRDGARQLYKGVNAPEGGILSAWNRLHPKEKPGGCFWRTCFSPETPTVLFPILRHLCGTLTLHPYWTLTPQSSANWKDCRGISSTVTWPPPRWTFTEALQGRESQTFLACQPALWSVVKTCGSTSARSKAKSREREDVYSNS